MKVETLIPEVYYSQSRDFSYIGRLFEMLFNYMKTGADCIAVNPDSPNIDATTIELVALTLGFESKHRYTTRDLIYIISSFSSLIRKKGTIESINSAIKLLMNSQKIKMDLIKDFVGSLSDEEDNFTFNIKIPEQLKDTILLEDLFDYILPAGMLYRLNRITPQSEKQSNLSITSEDNYAYSVNSDTSQLLSQNGGGYVYVLLTDDTPPTDWASEYTNYYVYNFGGFIQNTNNTYAPKQFYRREQNNDIGTIISGTVMDMP